MHPRPIDRRTLLKSGAAAAGGVLAGASLVPGAAAGLGARPGLTPWAKTERVILVAFAGGVRTRETFGTPGNVPTLAARWRTRACCTRA